MKTKLSVMVADDDTLSVRGLLAQLKSLNNIAQHIAQPKSGMDVLELLKKKKYDVIFLDQRMYPMDGLETALNVRKQAEAPAIIFHTEESDEEEIAKIIAAGFHQWLDKNCTYDKVLPAINAALSNQHFLPERILKLMDKKLRELALEKNNADKTSLSQAEKEVFIDYCNLYSIAEIKSRRHTDARTVRGQLNSAKSKLGLHSQRECLLYAQRNGYNSLLEFSYKRSNI
jgi:two-component system response regulator DesR